MLISAGSIIKDSIKLYRENSQIIFRYLGLLLLVSSLPYLLAPFYERGIIMVLISAIISIGSGVATIWISIAFIRMLAARYQSKPADNIKPALQKATGMILPIIMVYILVGLAVLGGLILLIIPGIIFAVWFSFAIYALLLDDKEIIESLKASKALVQGRWFGVFWRLLAPGFVFGLIAVIVQTVVMLPLGDLIYTDLGVIVGGIITVAAGLVITPLSTAAPTILYVELKKTSKAPAPAPAQPKTK